MKKQFKITWIHTSGVCEKIYKIENKEKARMKFYVNFASEFQIIKIEEV